MHNGGAFPLDSVCVIRGGREDVAAQCERFMTIWRSRYKAEMIRRLEPFGPTSPEKVERRMRGHILELVFYLQSIEEYGTV